jgi:hypothetical protein
MRQFNSDEQIDRIGRGLLACDLPKPEWTHAAHFAAACWLLRRYRLPQLEALMPDLIRAYNTSIGVANSDTGGYHHTITLASLRAAHAWLASRPNVPLCQAVTELLEGEFGRAEWLMRYWSRERLLSLQARRGWVEPDLAAPPF